MAREPADYDPARRSESPSPHRKSWSRWNSGRAPPGDGRAGRGTGTRSRERRTKLTVVEAHALELRHRMDALGYTEAAFLEARSAHEAVEQERREAEMMGIRALVEVRPPRMHWRQCRAGGPSGRRGKKKLRQAAKSLALLQ